MSFMLHSAVPDESAATHYLPTGRITIAGLDGDAAILKAMRAGEDETVAAYEQACAHPDADPKCRATFERFLRDALQHRAWAEDAARLYVINSSEGEFTNPRNGRGAAGTL